MNDKIISIEEYRKLKGDKVAHGHNHTSSCSDRKERNLLHLEEGEDPSLQVDYEPSDSSPTQSPRENNLKGVVSSEEATIGDSTNAFSGNSNTEGSKQEKPFISTYVPWRIPKRKSSIPVDSLLTESDEPSSRGSPEAVTVLDSNKSVEESILTLSCVKPCNLQGFTFQYFNQVFLSSTYSIFFKLNFNLSLSQ